MIALVDCNSFFCSVERVFHPGLWGKPVCVLSNNDGIIVALTPEAKRIGLHRGDPIFKVQDVVRRNSVAVFSGNMYLYAAMSRRIVSILRKSVMKVENYSIDESFCYMDGYGDPEKMMREIAQKIKLWTDIPVSVGIAPSKTLAKMGSKFAKNYKGYHDVCVIDTDEKRRKALELFDLADVWGVGRRTYEKLRALGIDTPLQLADKKESWVKSHFTKPTYLTWLELNGVDCIDTTEKSKRQTISTTRVFGEMISDLSSLKSSVSTFASSVANKLRAQGSVCSEVSVFISSNTFREDLEQYGNWATYNFLVPTSDTTEIVHAANLILERIFRPGIKYKRSGVWVGGIVDACPIQLNLFDPISNRPERSELMRTVDSLNQRYGLKTIQLAVEGEREQAWKVKSEHKSPNYLTELEDILVVGKQSLEKNNDNHLSVG